ncbi:asparagine synthase (glutamine-hydrolysing) [Algoriphagus ratkowskyi]|uniref:asparagine synthase (glutamine-hydrolyzing) n=1 Tax=Algoriphagus ratkowskyi TaxID=57028 RepID=A0A2W7SF36_9BACT|nr:asparagine synthase (glutamine-hydrolyzing) [Algoriphagus ratkowskyi]PZX49312.1 asparagine synthase (glutamine-hydrolysing) [Algoriphagus ratkowskyi]TXD75377.1 asparagine synthase (glutamine-hydrolyzing) [Algoriphagus ratkowskyi]
MCGIHLIWGKGANEEAINSMLQQSQHRGPDQQASFSPWPGLWIGVNRLKILHTGSEADQPFWSPDGSSLLIWNGELYNYQEIRNLLIQMGIIFITQSDTEVVMQVLRVFGIKGLEKLQGMFALIYVDLTEKSLLVSRDSNGEKPLYYAQNPDTLLVSSECKSIQSLKSADLDNRQLEPYFYLRAPFLGNTFLQGIHEWKPGLYSKILNHSAFRWDHIPDGAKLSCEPTFDSFKETLTDSVLNQFHADVPVGVQLSGGADSSLLYALWYKETGIPLPSFTIQVQEKYRNKYLDGDAASRFSKQVPSSHHLIKIDQATFWENWEDYLKSMDQPIGDSAGFLNWMIGKEAKKSIKVLISGAGADELWGGYQRHKAFDFYQNHKGLLLKFQSILAKIPLKRGYQKFISSIDSDPRRTFLNFSGLDILPNDLALDYDRVFNKNLPNYIQMLDFDRQVYLVQDVLKIQDNALMAHSIEGRSPYLDASMLDVWRNVEDEQLLKGKPWIKQFLTELDLHWVSERKKMGFGLPLQEWFAENGEFAKRVFSSIKAFEKTHGEHFPTKMRVLAAKPEHGVKHHFLTLYNLFLLAEWVKLHRL